MIQIHGKIEGDKVFLESTQLHGMVTGSVTVASGVELELHGTICRDLHVLHNATVYLHGTVGGNVVNDGGTIDVFGVVRKQLLDNSGTTTIHTDAIISGIRR
ncbi:hypothetical protein [Sorangium cellulosum]|uniref:hypothetical protein n=1 Tax=Sorangium cellulosum TaxID=56 RepID=UPI000B2BA42F|nr:hypothetical protein [Sorangium cellulosum]